MADIPGALFKIFKNPVYLVTSLGICCEVSVVSGFVFFLPKYLESEFGASKIMASLLTGQFYCNIKSSWVVNLADKLIVILKIF